MAVRAIGRECSILIVLVTIVARDRTVRARQRKLRVVVCKGRRMPDGRYMTGCAVRRETTCSVVGTCR